MSETLRDLVVSLSLQTDNFTRNIKSVNKQIQEAESRFKLATAGVEGFERTTAGLTTQLSITTASTRRFRCSRWSCGMSRISARWPWRLQR